MLVGALLAVLVVLVVGGGGYLYSQRAGGSVEKAQQQRVVLIFESPAKDGATVAGLIAHVADGEMRDVDPETTVTIPGTSYNRLGDAFVFGGGAAVARALGDQDAGGATAYVSVPITAWRTAVDSVRGVQVSVPSDMTVFDGASMTTIRAGDQRLTAAQVEAVLRGLLLPRPTGSGDAEAAAGTSTCIGAHCLGRTCR